MAKPSSWPNNNGLKKEFWNHTVILGRSFDLFHGRGWFCQVYDQDGYVGFGFHRTNRYTAVRRAYADIPRHKAYIAGMV